MFKGKRNLGRMKGLDNSGDGMYGLVRKWKAIAKKRMHKVTRLRLKREVTTCQVSK